MASLPPGAESLPSDIDLDTGDAAPMPDLAVAPTIRHVGRYALKHKLGEGGLGQVHEAWDPLLSRTVAVKTLQFDVGPAQRTALDRLFLHEARAAANLSHPHIVTVHDAGLAEHGVYIAMERLQGRDLRQALAAGWRPQPALAAQLVRRVADALAYAHARGVVHCDIKPANIFLTRKDKPTVLDFGIARVAHGAAGPALEGVVAGSPHYLAPEQLRGGPIDARTDVYALGVVLFELLAGRKAFEGGSLQEIVEAVLHGEVPTADTVHPEVPAGLAAVAAQAMARDPDHRFAGAAELAQALRPWQGRAAHDEPAATRAATPNATPATTPAAPERPAARSRKPLWSVAAGVLGLAVAAALWAVDHAPQDVMAAAPAPAVVAAVTPVVNTPPAAAEAASQAAPEVTPDAVAQAASPPPRPAPTRAARPAARPAASTAPAPAPVAAAAPGELRLAVSPWGEVEVDGRPVGVTPPLVRLELPAGVHEVTVRNGDFPPYTTRIEVGADQPVLVRHRFGS